MKSIFRKLHLWLSLPFGVLITLICFSGAMLVFEQEVTEWMRPDLYRVERLSGPMLTQEEAAAIKPILKKIIKQGKIVAEDQITATLAINTGPGLVGIGILVDP